MIILMIFFFIYILMVFKVFLKIFCNILIVKIIFFYVFLFYVNEKLLENIKWDVNKIVKCFFLRFIYVSELVIIVENKLYNLRREFFIFSNFVNIIFLYYC